MRALLISQGKTHGSAAFWLAKKLQLKNIPVVLAFLNWPRDELFFYPDGKLIMGNEEQSKKIGATILPGMVELIF